MKKLEAMEGVTVNGVQGEELEQTAPHIVSASFQGCAVRYSYMPWKTNRSMCLPVLLVLPTTRESAARWWPSECQKRVVGFHAAV